MQVQQVDVIHLQLLQARLDSQLHALRPISSSIALDLVLLVGQLASVSQCYTSSQGRSRLCCHGLSSIHRPILQTGYIGMHWLCR